jgi:hypothetical protein
MIQGRRLALALTISAGAALLAPALLGCYDIPKPRCGFRCGPDGACPEDYTCAPSDGRCHLDGSPPELACEGPARPDGPAAPDAAVVDAAVDVMLR